MSLFAVVFIAFVGFLTGFLLGVKGEKPNNKYKFETDENTARLQKEVENFLNYDGSVQE